MSPKAATDTICYTPATELARMIREKQISPVELTEALIERIDEVNPKLNAYVTLLSEEARAAAHGAEEAITRGDDLGPLHGVPVSIKDLAFTKGVRTTGGSRVFEPVRPYPGNRRSRR